MAYRSNPFQIATVSLSGKLSDKLEVAAAAGFDGVEIFENDLVASDLQPEEIRKRVQDLGLTAEMYQPFRDLEGWTGVDRERAFDRVQRKFDLMDRLGCDLMLLCSNAQPESSAEDAHIIEDLQRLGEIAQARGIRIAYEGLAWAPHVNDHRHAWRIVQGVGHAAIGLALDSFHSLARGIPSSSILDIAGDKIFFVQLADAPRMQLDYLSWSRHYRNMPGQGALPLVDYVAALISVGYAGPLSLEIFNDRLRAGSAKMAADDGIRALLALQDDAAQKLGQSTALPPRQHCDGVEFIEFAADGTEAEALEHMLTSLGFSLAGRHRGKDVRRWQQGSANIVINREQRNFAHSYDVVHGASVCAVGVRVANKAATLARAEGLMMRPFAQEAPDSQMALEGVRSIGGTLLYVVSSDQCGALWDNEFETESVAADGCGLNRIDHLSATVPFGEFLSSQLLWTSLFDLEKSEIVNVADPAGLIESQALQNLNGDLRVTMNASAARDTLANRHISRTFGAPFQHLAFGCDDIFAAANAMQAAGAEFLEVPANYYDDLAARHGLDDDFVARLIAHNILYDRDKSGDYLQLFTRAFDKRFFFEIVQRRGYQGYGAINAPVRLAAQARFRGEETPF